MKTALSLLKIQKSNRLQSEQDIADLLKHPLDKIREIILNREKYYGFFQEPKKNGEFRDIHPPQRELKKIQKEIKKFFDNFKWPPFVQGGVKKRSIFTNAKLHCHKAMVAWLDIQEFFPSTTTVMVSEALLKVGIGEPAAKLLAELCTYKNALPQGSSTSVCLANLVLLDVDSRFYSLCQKHGLVYSRYIDDISISGNIDFRSYKGEFLKIITQKGYAVAADKIDFIGKHRPQLVNNLVVNDKIRPSTKFIRRLKSNIRCCWDPQGAEIVAADSGVSPQELKLTLWGRITFLKQFNPKVYRQVRALMVKAKFENSKENN